FWQAWRVSFTSVAFALRGGLLKCGERGLNALTLLFGDQAGQHLAEVRMLGARMDVLPPVGLQERSLDRSRLGLVDLPAALCREVARVGLGLALQDSVDRGDQLDELVDRLVALLRSQPRVMAHPLQLVEDGVLAFLFPVIEEHVLEQLGESGVRIDALSIM